MSIFLNKLFKFIYFIKIGKIQNFFAFFLSNLFKFECTTRCVSDICYNIIRMIEHPFILFIYSILWRNFFKSLRVNSVNIFGIISLLFRVWHISKNNSVINKWII